MKITSPGAMPDKCIPQETYLDNVTLARAYVPFEKLCKTFSPMTSLMRGTAFPPLYNVYGWERRQEVIEDE